jgi:hypothetical protein
LQRISTDAGTSIDRTDEQFENADSPIRVSWESDSKANIESKLHDEKQDLQRISAQAGIQIKRSLEYRENADSSIRVSCEPDSKAIHSDDEPQPVHRR